MDGTGKRTLGWTIARNALKRIKAGDHIFVALQRNRIARLGTVTDLAVQDSQWKPFIPRSHTQKNGAQGRRIHVRGGQELVPDDREQVVELPPGFRLTGAHLRTTLSLVKVPSLADLRRVLADTTNWVRLWANFDYERALSGYIAAYPHRLEDRLLPYPRERRGRGKTRMDVLLIDKDEIPVVVECKQGAPTISHLKQLRAYMAQVRKDTSKSPRGILFHGGARDLRDEVRRAALRKPKN